VCVSILASVIRNGERLYYIVICGPPAVLYFSTLCHKHWLFFGQYVLNIKCVFWFSLQLLSERFIILKKNLVKAYQKCTYVFSSRAPNITDRSSSNLNFLRRFLKKTTNIKFHKNLSSESLFNADRRTDKTKPIVPFHNVANATKTHQVYERGHDH